MPRDRSANDPAMLLDTRCMSSRPPTDASTVDTLKPSSW